MIRTIADFEIFDNIDSEEKAYWLGFIYADGNIASLNYKKIRYEFELTLKEEDHNHLIKFCKFIKSNKLPVVSKSGKLFSYKRSRVCFANKHYWNTLNNYGCIPKKSLVLKFPNINIFKDKSLIKHFIRGYIDGDGCISYKNKEHTDMTLSILGTREFLSELQKNLPLERENKIFTENNIFKLVYNGSRGKYILNYLYNEATIYLERKYLRYKEYCRLY